MSRSTTQPRPTASTIRLNEPDEDGAYLVDHTSYIYFMDPDGDYLTHFVFGQGPEKMAEVMRKHLD